MNKKGFTLVELLGVIIMIGALILVVATPIVSQINKQKVKLDDASLNLIYSTTETYIDKNKNSYPLKNNAVYYITLKQLLDSKFIEEEFIKTYSTDVLSKKSIIKVTVNGDTYAYNLLPSNSYNSIGMIYDTISSGITKYTYMDGEYFQSYVDKPIYYNGILWDIIGKNADGTIKLLSRDSITPIYVNKGNEQYNDSYARKWLNTEFLGSLVDSSIISNQKWCVDTASDKSVSSESCSNSINDKVGLLTLSEVNRLASDYVRNSTLYVLMTQTNDNTGSYFRVNNLGGIDLFGHGYELPIHIRPSINIIAEAPIISGTGTSSDPYMLARDNSVSLANVRLKDAPITVGMYVKYLDRTYRIMKMGDNSFKMILSKVYSIDPDVDDSEWAAFSTDNQSYNVSNGIGFYLNNTKYTSFVPNDVSKNLISDDSIFNGIYVTRGSNYRLQSLKDNQVVTDAVVGLPKLGELFASPNVTGRLTPYWTQNEFDQTNAYSINNDNIEIRPKSDQIYIRPVINVTSNAIITSGNGLKDNPLVLDGK